MLGWIVYFAGAMTAAMLLTGIFGCFRSGNSDHGPYRLIFGMLVFSLASPFVFVEVQTKMAGDSMAKAVKRSYDDLPIDGDMEYYKVLYSINGKAKVVVVGNEKDKYGAIDRPAFELAMQKNDGGWAITSYRVLHSDKLQKDELGFLPFN